jgi:predicted ABC-type exoprotein transport system permease subunit
MINTKYIVFGIIQIVFINNALFSQKTDNKVTQVIEVFLKSDTLKKSNIELATKKTYFVNKIQEIKYKNQPYMVYSFGNSASHLVWYHFLFISSNSKDYFIIGNESEPIQNFLKLNEVFTNVSLLSDKNKSLIYKLMIDNYENRKQGKVIERDNK